MAADGLPPDLAIGRYESGAAVCDAFDPAGPDAASALAAALERIVPGCVVEHIGSTAVPGLPGKGVLDLMLLYGPGALEVVRGRVDALGFQRQSGRDPWPEERPMRLGSIAWGGRRYRVHLHILSADSDEVDRLRAFRDRLRADAALRAAYEALKRRIIAAGVTDPVEYSYAKASFFESLLS